MWRERRVFVAGATGETGRVLLGLAGDLPIVPHVRPGSRSERPAGAVEVDLADVPALARAMQGCTTVLQLIGTTRSRFGDGDTYEAADIATTRRLVEAARLVGVDHFILLSSVGAGRPWGAYLRAKAAAERCVLSSGLPYTIVRPSAFVGGRHQPPRALTWLGDKLGGAKYRPIRLEQLAQALLGLARRRECAGAVLEGAALWDAVPKG